MQKRKCKLCGNTFPVKTLFSRGKYCIECMEIMNEQHIFIIFKRDWIKYYKLKHSLTIVERHAKITFPAYYRKYLYNNGKFVSEVQKRYALTSWSYAVKYRDNETCQRCGRTVYLRSHHIIPISQDESKILDISNGITLCEPCHDFGFIGSVHNVFGRRCNTKGFWKWFNFDTYEDVIDILKNGKECIYPQPAKPKPRKRGIDVSKIKHLPTLSQKVEQVA